MLRDSILDFLSFIREEKRFDSVDDLARQVKKDIEPCIGQKIMLKSNAEKDWTNTTGDGSTYKLKYIATVSIFSSLQVFIILTAISPLFATNTFSNIWNLKVIFL